MGYFLTGFVLATAILVAIFILYGRKRLTARHKPQSALQPDRTEPKHAKRLEELGRLTGGLAHEMKNPLSTIKVNLKLIAEELERLVTAEAVKAEHRSDFARALRKITVIQKETDRLEQILEGFLRYVTETKLQTAATDINELLSDMVDFYSPQAHSNAITVRQVLYDEPLICKADPDMLKQVILNLFINARQAMIDGGELIVTTHRQDRDVIIKITDTGSGIEPDRQERIFDVYYSSRPGGSGLGLATAKRIVEAHNGTITVQSDVGIGSSFTIKLPLQDE